MTVSCNRNAPYVRPNDMRRFAIAVAVLFLATTACGQNQTGAPVSGSPVSAVELQFEPDVPSNGRYAAISEEPISRMAFGSWYDDDDAGPDDDPPAEPQHTDPRYVALVGDSGCDTASSVELARDGDDLEVRFVVEEERDADCAEPFTPYVQVEVPAHEVDGVRTINGATPVSEHGPGQLDVFELLPVGPDDDVGTAEAVELGTADARSLARTLDDDVDDDGGAVDSALTEQPESGQRGFGFVLSGCSDTRANLVVAGGTVSAELVGGDDTVCEVPQHYLATFTVDADHVPPDVELATAPR